MLYFTFLYLINFSKSTVTENNLATPNCSTLEIPSKIIRCRSINLAAVLNLLFMINTFLFEVTIIATHFGGYFGILLSLWL